MEFVPIQAIPNQSLSIVLNEVRWDLQIRTTNGSVSFDIEKNGEVIIEGARAVAGMRIIPAQYQEDGNFAMITNNGELPDYTKFGVSQSLVFVSAAELEVLRAPVTPPITAAYFDDIAPLPLRFAPQGYTTP